MNVQHTLPAKRATAMRTLTTGSEATSRKVSQKAGSLMWTLGAPSTSSGSISDC